MTSFTHPLHLYRALLRETTYLFDPNARKFTSDLVKSSFRRKAGKVEGQPWKIQPHDAGRLPTLADRHQLKRGRKFLSLLSRANDGYSLPLSKVLKLTYGRMGHRKKQIMDKIMAHPSTEERKHTNVSMPDDPVPTLPKGSRKTEFTRDWRPPPKFDALMRSQAQLHTWLNLGGRIKTKPVIDLTNRWGKPMPQCRVRNAVKDWYSTTASMLLPPLSEKERDHIQALAGEKTEVSKLIKKRRCSATVPVAAKDEKEETRVSESVLLRGSQKPVSLRVRRLIRRPHKLTRRYIRRIYGREILRQTPVVRGSADGKRYAYSWDTSVDKAHTSIKPSRVQIDALFG